MFSCNRELGGQSGRNGMATKYAACFTYTALTALFQVSSKERVVGLLEQRLIVIFLGIRVVIILSGNLTMEFATLPPCFSPGEAILSAQDWSSIFPGFANYPSSLKRLLPCLLASVVVYHSNWLADNLPPTLVYFRPISGPCFSEIKGACTLETEAKLAAR
jgi:hypothetical protein